MNAIMIISDMGPKARPALQRLRCMQRCDPDEEIRIAATVAINNISPDNATACTIYLRSLNSSNLESRHFALIGLEAISHPDKQIVRATIDIFKHGDNSSRYQALKTLSHWIDGDQDVYEAISFAAENEHIWYIKDEASRVIEQKK
jgi:hypothetical protein